MKRLFSIFLICYFCLGVCVLDGLCHETHLLSDATITLSDPVPAGMELWIYTGIEDCGVKTANDPDGYIEGTLLPADYMKCPHGKKFDAVVAEGQTVFEKVHVPYESNIYAMACYVDAVTGERSLYSQVFTTATPPMTEKPEPTPWPVPASNIILPPGTIINLTVPVLP